MSLAITAALVENTGFKVVLDSVASGGTGPYTVQWYRSTSSGFTPGGGNILSGKTSVVLYDDTVIPGTQYYYKVVVTDTGHSNDTATSNEVGVLTDTGTQEMNKFTESPVQGQLDLRFNTNSITVQLAGSIADQVASVAVKFTTDVNGVPVVTPCTANTDQVAGFLNFNSKNSKFKAKDYVEMSMGSNVMYLVSTAAINRGAKVMIVVATIGGVITATSGKPIAGIALDQASGAGQLIRILLTTPTVDVV